MITLTEEQAQQIDEALDAVKQMCEVAHPQFNWGASFLQADGVALLNEAPQAATKALATIRAARAQEQAEQEPVGEVDIHMDFLRINWKDGRHPPKGTKLYAAPVEPVKQEPVGRWNWNEAKFEWLTKFDYYKHHMTPLYTAPQKREWVELSDGEIVEVMETWGTAFMNLDPDTAPDPDIYIAHALIAAFKEANK